MDVDHGLIFCGERLKANPEAYKIAATIFEKYYPPKQYFLDKLAGKCSNRAAILTNMTAGDSREFQKALSKVKMKNLRICRLGRGPRHGVDKYRSYLPIEKSERFSVYAYPKSR